MPENREHSIQPQAGAAAVITTRIAHDPDFADEFVGIVEGGDKETIEAFVRSAGIRLEPPWEIVPVPGGFCICRGPVCFCIVYRRQP
jgi:hypothetical protein